MVLCQLARESLRLDGLQVVRISKEVTNTIHTTKFLHQPQGLSKDSAHQHTIFFHLVFHPPSWYGPLLLDPTDF